MLIHMVNLALATAPNFNGELQSQIHFSPDGELLDLQDSMIFSPRLELKDNITMVIDLDMRWSPFLQLENIEDSQYIEKVQPISIRTEELWLQTSSSYLTTTIGMQNILWATGKGISQVNWMAPLDLRNPTTFSEYISVPAIRLDAHKNATSAELILQPWFMPALLPQSDISLFPSEAESFSIDGQALDIRSQEGKLSLPNQSWENMQLGGQLSFHQALFDITLFGFYGNDTLPQANGELLLMGFQTDQDRVDIGIPLEYPKITAFGSTGSIVLPGNILSWFEYSYIIPQETKLVVSERQMNALESLGTIEEVPTPLPSVSTQNGEQYMKWLLGFERYFGNVVLSGQWIHGLFIERQDEALSDYVLINADWAIRPTIRWDNTIITDGSGLFLRSNVNWLIQDQLNLGFGGLWLPTLQASQLNNFKNVEQAYLSASYLF